MTIYATTFILTGSNNNIPQVYANTLSPNSNLGSNISINSDVTLAGNVLASKRMDVSKTLFCTFRPESNISFEGSNELHCTSKFPLDLTSTDMYGLDDINMAIPLSNIRDPITGILHAPVSGYYNLHMQGSFSNVDTSNPKNGVYYYLPNRSFANARVATHISSEQTINTSHTLFLLSNDQVYPTFYSSDSNASLLANGETYIGFSLLQTANPQHSNYYRI